MAANTTLWRMAAVSASRAARSRSSPPPEETSLASNPARSMAWPMTAGSRVPGVKETVAFSVARLTSAVRTPGSFAITRSTRLTHDAQVMPPTASSTVRAGTENPARPMAAAMSAGVRVPGS